VFDPLAVLMFIAVNQDMKRKKPAGIIPAGNDTGAERIVSRHKIGK
jgi:hypothetical protein